MRLVPRAEANRAGAFAMGEGREGLDAMRGIKAQANTPYAVETHSFLSPLQVPCQQPPWGRISAIDLTARKILWSRPLGTNRDTGPMGRSEEHTSELQSLMRISYAVFCLKTTTISKHN